MTARSGGRRRGSGEGGVYQRASDGRWVGVVDLGWIDGKRRRRTVYGATRAEAVAKLDQLRAERRAGRDLAVQAPTLSQWLDEWLREIKSSDGTRPSTLRRYQEVIRTHLAPGLGRIRVDRLAPRDVQRFLAGRRTTLAPASVVEIHGVRRVALGDAERMGLVTRNVARVVRPASLPRNERPVLTPQEARALLAEARGDRYEAVFILALGMGLRRGEVLGLRWEDIDLLSGRLHIRRALQRVQGSLQLVETKSHRSSRALPIPKNVVPVLDRQRARQLRERLAAGTAWQEEGLVFATSIGTPVEPRNVNRRFTQLRDRAGLSWLRLHDLRHACATFLLAEGVEPRTVMEILGHSTIRLTMDTYGHVLPERLAAAAEAMDRALWG